MGTFHEIELEYRFDRAKNYVFRRLQLPSGKLISSRLGLGDKSQNFGDACSAYDYEYLRKKKRKPNRSNGYPLRLVDLFSGCGGLTLGIMDACATMGVDLHPVAAVDIDESALQVYKHNFPSASTFKRDIRRILDGEIGSKPTKAENQFLNSIGKVNLLLAGPPCQGHSDLNNHTRRNDERNILYERVARFVEIATPAYVMIENIPAAVHGKQGVVKRTLESIASSGYNIESDIIRLDDIGVPQRRKRHVVIASKSPIPSLKEIIKKHKVSKPRSVKWAIGDLEDEPQVRMYSRPSNYTRVNRMRINYLHDNDILDLPNKLRPPCHKLKNHTYRSMYGRMEYDKPSQTITSGFSSPGQGRFIHPSKRRTITPHEAARLQFFPDNFDFSLVKTKKALATMIGNAVPMKMSYILALELLGTS
jgi:DNA (cytosine-5)-methyltransferase 1